MTSAEHLPAQILHERSAPKVVDYSFLEPIRELSTEDKAFLQYHGCLDMPKRDVLDAVVQRYFLYVHPHLPLIDEGWFWYIYTGKAQSDSSRIPLFLLQCMLLAGCPYVAISTIHDLGFETIRAARAAYYARAKALYDFEVTSDSLTRARGCLLITFHVLRNEPSINNYWLSIAIHHAKVEGADCYDRCVDVQRRNQLKRLWWSCIIRDRSLSLGLRRPASIVSSAFEQTWPPLSEEDLASEVSQSHVYSSEAKKQLTRSVAALCNLCAVLMDLLQLLYPADRSSCKDRTETLKRVYIATENLDRWHDMMTARHDSNKIATNSVILFRSLLDIYYETAKAALCNHRIMLTLDERSEQNFERLQAKKELQTALRGISQSLRAIIKAGMVDYSPIAMVVYIALPSICHKLGNTSHDQSEPSTPVASGNIYQSFLKVLQLKYEGADNALGNMSKLVDDMNMDHARSPSTVNSDLIYEHNMGNGLDMIIASPHKYMRMVATLDYFLRQGHFPSKTDLDIRAEHDVSSQSGLDRAIADDALSVMPEGLPSDVTGQPFLDFSFDDFMLDGPFAGIERLSDMLHNHYDWT